MSKKLFLPFVLLFFLISLCFSNPVDAVSFRVFYGVSGGSTGDMDRHNNGTCTDANAPWGCCTGSGTGTCDPADNDISLVVENSAGVIDYYLYHFDGDSTEATVYPNYIRPTNYSTAGVWVLAHGMAVNRSPIPAAIFKDSDTTDNDDSGKILLDCTDTGSGTEDCDITIQVQIAGVLTSVLQIDADGNIEVLAHDMDLAAGKVYKIDGTQISITNLATFSSSNFRGRLSDPNGTGGVVFGTNAALTTPTITSPTIQTSIGLPSGAVDVITEIAAGLKTGADVKLVTGTAGTSGNFPAWNADGDIVDSGSAPGNFASSAQGVTNGNSHDHAGGDGAQIDHGGLAGLGDDDHTQYSEKAGDAYTGVHDFGGADSLELPNNGTVNAEGEVTIDTTSGQLRYYGASAERVLSPKKVFSVIVLSPADTMEPHLFKAPYGLTITDIHCIVEAATSAVIDIQECDSAGANCATVDATITCDADGAEDDGSLTNGSIDANDWVKLDIGTVTGTVETVTVTVYYTIVAD